MNILFLYLSRQFLKNTLAIMAGLMSIIYLFDTLELLRRSSNKDHIGMSDVLEMSFYKLPEVTQQLIPFGILFAAMMSLWQLSRRQELVVLRCAGLSAWRFLAPLILSAFGIGLFYILVLNPFSAAMLSRYEMLQSERLGKSQQLVTISREGLWLKERDSEGEVIFHASAVTMPDWTLRNVMALYFDNQGNNYQRVDAETAKLEDGLWVFKNAQIHRPAEKSLSLELYTIATEMTLDGIKESYADPETISFWKMRDFIKTLESTGLNALHIKLYHQGLLATPLMLSAMVLIAAVVSLRPPRARGQLIMVLTGIGAGFAIFFLTSFLKALGTTEQVPLLLAAWAPSLICCLIGTAILMRTEDG